MNETAEPLDEGDEPLVRTSFFATGPGSDKRVCDYVWTMFVKDSNGRGFDAHAVGVRKLSGHQVLKIRETEEETHMAATTEEASGVSELTPRQAAILAAYQELSVSGASLSSLDIARKAKVSAPSEDQLRQLINSTLWALRKKGLLPPAEPGRARQASKKSDVVAKPARRPRQSKLVRVKGKPRASRKAVAAVAEAKPSAALVPASAYTASDPLVVAMREELARCTRRAEAIRDAIIILESPQYGGAAS